MGSIFTQALTALQGFFSRSFWFGSFLPVVVFAAANIVIARLGLGWGPANLTEIVGADKWVWAAPVAVALIVFAYAVSPLVPLCRAILDGRRLPAFLADRLRAEPLARQRTLDRALEAANKFLADIDAIAAGAATRFGQASTRGAAITGPGEPAMLAVANQRLDELRDVLTTRMPSYAELGNVINAVARALETNKTSTTPGLAALPLATLAVLNGRTERNTVAARARYEIKRLDDRRKAMPREVQPTMIGNARDLSEQYSQRVYQVDFGFLWPRVQLVLKEEDAVSKRIDAARALVDFAVLSLVLSTALLLVWLPLLAARADSPWAFLLLGAIGPIFVRFFYQLVVESQISLGELVQVVVDKYRFDVLTMLHIKPPATLSAEREIWRTLSAVARGEPPPDADGSLPYAELVWNAPP